MGTPRDMSPEEVAPLVEGDWSYLDVRTKEEFVAGHCPGAVNIPIMEMGPAGMTPNPAFMDQVAARYPDSAAAQLVVGCKAGPRSTRAVQILAAQNYKNLINVVGGYMAWEAAGLPTEQ